MNIRLGFTLSLLLCSPVFAMNKENIDTGANYSDVDNVKWLEEQISILDNIGLDHKISATRVNPLKKETYWDESMRNLVNEIRNEQGYNISVLTLLNQHFNVLLTDLIQLRRLNGKSDDIEHDIITVVSIIDSITSRMKKFPVVKTPYKGEIGIFEFEL